MIYSMENIPCLALIHSPQSQCYLGDINYFSIITGFGQGLGLGLACLRDIPQFKQFVCVGCSKLYT